MSRHSKRRKKKSKKKMASEDSAPTQNNTESVHEKTQPHEQRYIYPPFPSSIEVNFPRSIEERNEANQKRQEARDKWKLRLEVGTALFVGITVVINWFIWTEMNKTTEATKIAADATKLAADAATAATAAWIAEERFVVKSIEKDRIIFDIVFKNVGKTPARDVQAGMEFTFINQSLPNDLTDIPKRDPYQCPGIMNVNLGILPPDKTWGTTFPTEIGRMSIEEIQRIKNRTSKLVVHICAKYRDILTDRERITEVGGYFPGTLDPADLAIAIYPPYSRMK